MIKLVIGAVLAAAVVAGSLVGAAAANEHSGTVVRIVDGDTIVVSINNLDQTIRLLNVDTPETKDPNQPVECLGPEASEYLKAALPVGSRVKLDFDAVRHDRYGRTLAGVFSPEGALVNAEIARQGLGLPVEFNGNSKFLPPVKAAHEEAKAAKKGLFSESMACTLPAQLAQASKTLEAVAAAPPASTSASAGAAVGTLVSAIAAAHTLRALLSAGREAKRAVLWAAFTSAETSVLTAALDAGISKASRKLEETKALEQTLSAAERKAVEERRAAEARAAAEKKAAEERAAAEAAAKAAADEAARASAAEAERLRNLPAPYVPPAPQPYVPPSPQPYVPPANPYPGYTGPRCYAPGGKTWRHC
jgi:micrococcal nuclease